MRFRSFILAVFLALPWASSYAQVGISVNIAPPVIPVYAQPPCPVEGYLWTPGYWGYDSDYYWVPGAWVAPPTVGLLWTPAWWGWNNGAYVFNAGYWGPTVGFYGGINYGHGYWGDGYGGGHWSGNSFTYNTAVTNVNRNVIHNTYIDKNVMNKEANRNHTGFNGGPNGVKAQANAQQKAAAENAKKMGPTSQQLARQEAAKKDPNLQASNNKGHPNQEAIKSFMKENNGTARVSPTDESGDHAPIAGGAGQAEGKPGNMAEHRGQGAEKFGEAGNKHEAENVHGNKQNLEGDQAKAHNKVPEHGAQHGMNQHAMNQQRLRQQQMTPQHHQQMGGNQMKMGGNRPPTGGNRPHPPPPQQGKKKPDKP